MKILTVNISDTHGGATRAAKRLHKGLLNAGKESLFLTNIKSSDEKEVIGSKSILHKFLYKIKYRLDVFPLRSYKIKNETPFSVGRYGDRNLVDTINNIKPDIVHLHWIGGAMMRIEDIALIHAPIVWSLHDDWAYTGGCHIKWDCKNYKTSCGSCPVLNSAQENDLSREIYNRKSKTYAKKKDITVVGLSKWIATCAAESGLFKNFPVVNIPNPINVDKYAPQDELESRAYWNLPSDKKLILFGAMNADGDVRKGFKELKEALNYIQGEGIELVVFGMNKPERDQGFKFKIHYVGNISDDVALVKLYSAADVCVVPSLQENLSNVIVESLSCGTPVVGFEIGGNADMIDHQRNGYLAKAYSPKDLATGMEFILAADKSSIQEKCRQKAITNFEEKKVVWQYLDLYKSLLAKNTNDV